MTRRGLGVDGSQASIRFKNQLLTFQVGCCANTNSLYIYFDSGYSPEAVFALASSDNELKMQIVMAFSRAKRFNVIRGRNEAEREVDRSVTVRSNAFSPLFATKVLPPGGLCRRKSAFSSWPLALG
jgi:hypothetical protein